MPDIAFILYARFAAVTIRLSLRKIQYEKQIDRVNAEMGKREYR